MTTVSTHDPSHELPKWAIFLRGMAMGAADVVPGVSGGTMALVLGVYARFVLAITNIDLDLAKSVLELVRARFDRAAFGRLIDLLKEKDIFFLAILGTGIVTSLASFAKVIPYLIDTYPAHMNGLFFGMILGSIGVPVRMMEQRKTPQFIAFLIAAVGAYWFTTLPVLSIDGGLPFVFFSGAIAICAMILPGVSGSFLLLVLGQYKYILSSLRDLNFPVIIVFCAGCGVGLLSFSRFLKWLFRTYPSTTLAALAGLMLGSLQKIWPYKVVAEKVIVEGKVISAGRNVLPWAAEYTESVLAPGGLLALGIIAVLLLERLGHSGPQTVS